MNLNFFPVAQLLQKVGGIKEHDKTLVLEHIYDFERFFADIRLVKKETDWKKIREKKSFVIQKSGPNKVRLSSRDLMFHPAGIQNV